MLSQLLWIERRNCPDLLESSTAELNFEELFAQDIETYLTGYLVGLIVLFSRGMKLNGLCFETTDFFLTSMHNTCEDFPWPFKMFPSPK